MAGGAVEKFEESFARWLGVKSAFAFWKGRVAMYAILKCLGVGEGDEVILPGYTCVMDVNPIKYLGAKPVYVDIEPVTYNMNVNLLEEKITPQTRVIVAQHTYGYPAEMDAIMEIADRHGIPVVEDCCLALGSKYKGRLCGTFGVASYWSFQWNKPFTTGIGGMVTTDDHDLADKIEALCLGSLQRPPAKAAFVLSLQRLAHKLLVFPRTAVALRLIYRWLSWKGILVGSSDFREFTPTMPDDFFRGMSAGQARAGLRQLEGLEKNIAHRRRMRKIYDRLLWEAGWQLPEIPDSMDPVLVRYPVRIADKALAASKAPMSGIELGLWFEGPLHVLPAPLEVYDYVTGMCPLSEEASREVVNLPMHLRTSECIAGRSVKFIRRIGPAGQEDVAKSARKCTL